MIGGSGGSFGLAQSFIEAGKPVFPIPFVGGESRRVFEAVLADWSDVPVPGLQRSQFLKLAVPWKGSGTGPLRNLLLGVLDDRVRVFISYRRDDSGWTAGRLNENLGEELGARRVFFDVEGIKPAERWSESINRALHECEVGLMVIGKNYLVKGAGDNLRLNDPDDVVRQEILALIRRDKRVVPVFVDGAGTEIFSLLPKELAPVREQQAVVLDPQHWSRSLQTLLRAIDDILVVPDAVRLRKVTPPDDSLDEGDLDGS
jgi:hypothetical protein